MWDRPRSSLWALCSTGILPATIIALAALAPVASGQSTSWRGTASASWSNATNWTTGAPSGTTAVVFDSNSTANLSTNNDIVGLTPSSIMIANPTGPAAIGGNGLTIGAGGQHVPNWDEIIDTTDIDLPASGLRKPSLIRLSFLHAADPNAIRGRDRDDRPPAIESAAHSIIRSFSAVIVGTTKECLVEIANADDQPVKSALQCDDPG
jgi:hypothetical protein